MTFNQFKHIKVVTGMAYKHFDTLVSLVNSDNRIEIYASLNEEEMSQQLSLSDMAIVPASGILLEALACGCLTISGRSAHNQIFIHENYLKLRAFIDAGEFNPVEIRDAIQNAFSFREVKRVIDGYSDIRILRRVRQLDGEEAVQLRRATKEDLNLTYEWASNPTVRAYSFNKHTITLTEHEKWFMSRIDSPKCFFYIAEIKDVPVGLIRFDLKDNEAVISYLVDPKFHGLGLGQGLLSLGTERLLHDTTTVDVALKRISGVVMKENVPSMKAFQRTGFEMTDQGREAKFVKRIR